MAGVMKECTSCHNQFRTRSSRSAGWEKRCPNCFVEKKLSSAVTNANIKAQSELISLEDRLRKLEDTIYHVDTIISTEINSAMANLTPLDMIVRLENIVEEKMADVIKANTKNNETFREKIQKQIIILNNRVKDLM